MVFTATSLALALTTTYSAAAVKQPFINVKEKIEGFAGKQTKTPDGLPTFTNSVEDSIARRKKFGGIGVPRGVYRFKTHEEADEWMAIMLARSSPEKT